MFKCTKLNKLTKTQKIPAELLELTPAKSGRNVLENVLDGMTDRTEAYVRERGDTATESIQNEAEGKQTMKNRQRSTTELWNNFRRPSTSATDLFKGEETGHGTKISETSLKIDKNHKCTSIKTSVNTKHKGS